MLNASCGRRSCTLSSRKKFNAGCPSIRPYVESERPFLRLPQRSLFLTPLHIRKRTSRFPFSLPHSVPNMGIIKSICSTFHLPVPSISIISLISAIICLLIAIRFLMLFFFSTSRPRQTQIPPHRERVLILGASNEKGVGEAIALAYAKRGCRSLVLVARNEQGMEKIRQKCINLAKDGEKLGATDGVQVREEGEVEDRIKTFKADCSNPRDIDYLRMYIQANFRGIDTLHICFGVSALLPLLGIAGVDPIRPSSMDGEGASSIYADEKGLNAVSQAVNRASEVNVTGTAMVLAAFVPMLQTTSTHPAIALTSSAAALFPAPTRSIYAATKTAQLSLFRSVAIECQAHASQPQSSLPAEREKREDIRFLAVCPGTIATSFRSSAVDFKQGDGDLPADSAWGKDGGKRAERILTSEYVAEKTILGVDRFQRGEIVIPGLYTLGRWIDLIYPAYIAKGARKKYNY
ncbi:unnamed protein product [Calypogeia fissa]